MKFTQTRCEITKFQPDKTALIVSIDAEEGGLWGNKFKRVYLQDELDYFEGLERFQKIFDKYSMVPTYFVDYAVSSDKNASSLLRGIFKSGRCQIGAHMHAWCTPPFEEDLSETNSFFNNLPSELQLKKLQNLTESIEATFGIRPNTFRSGRFGFSDEVAELLKKLGYLVDSSVMPFCDLRGLSGRYLNAESYASYWIGDLLEVPVSNGFNIKNFKFGKELFDALTRSPYSLFHSIGILDRLGIFSKIYATPEHETINNLKKLALNYKKLNVPVWNIYFHSSSAGVGCNPYVKNGAQLEGFLSKLNMILGWCIEEAGFAKSTYIDTRERLIREKAL
ncbi:MAG: polysaccharide deacetylase family protein [Candidatus Omnitrophica bacterium]|nr:polysaccharide deacetylase family protein [Candidatus Omnitrophota bacterium]